MHRERLIHWWYHWCILTCWGGGFGWLENYHKRENWRHYCYALLASLLSHLKCNPYLKIENGFSASASFHTRCTVQVSWKRTGRGRWGLNKDMVRSSRDVNPLSSLTSSPPFPMLFRLCTRTKSQQQARGGLYKSQLVTWLHLNHSLCTNLSLLFPLAISISLSCLHHSTKRTYH